MNDPSAAEVRRRFPRTAVIHEWLTIPGGSEKVVLEILEIVGDADIFTSVYDPAPWPPAITERRVHPSVLNRLPGATRNYTRLLPLLDPAFRAFDLSSYDLVVSSNHASAKSVRVPKGTPHVCYCHTPMRYAWDPSFLTNEKVGLAARALIPAGAAWLRRVDRRRAAQPTVFVANSRFVAERIRRFYDRDSRVIHPPVEVDRWLEVPRTPGDAYLVFGRLVPYKRAEVAIAACERLGRPLIVAGDGRDLERLRALAGPTTTFVGRVPDAEVPELFARARALLFPGVEDFGIVPVEAQAAGVPVIGLGVGGIRDSVVDGTTGLLYDADGVDGLCDAIERFERLVFDERAARAHAATFRPEAFRTAFAELLLELGG